MSRSQLKDAEKAATRAWSELVAAVESAGDAAKSLAGRGYQFVDDTGSTVSDYADRLGDFTNQARRRTSHVVSDYSDKVGDYTTEARRRGGRARAALAGRRAPMPWGVIAGAVVVGAVAGWAAAMVRRRRDAEQSLVGLAQVEEPSYLSPDAADAVAAEIDRANGVAVGTVKPRSSAPRS